jgi:hypothetical protein
MRAASANRTHRHDGTVPDRLSGDGAASMREEWKRGRKACPDEDRPMPNALGSTEKIGPTETIDAIGRDLDEVRPKIEATRRALETALDGREDWPPEIRHAVAQLERIEAELERIEAGIEVSEGLA